MVLAQTRTGWTISQTDDGHIILSSPTEQLCKIPTSELPFRTIALLERCTDLWQENVRLKEELRLLKTYGPSVPVDQSTPVPSKRKTEVIQ